MAAGVLCVGAAAGSRAPAVRASARPGGAGLRSHASAVHPGAAPGAPGMQAPGMQGVDPMNGGGDHAQDKEKLYQLVAELSREETRETALLELSKKRETFPDLAPILWHSFGTTATLLQEIVCIYPLPSPPQLTGQLSFRPLHPSPLALTPSALVMSRLLAAARRAAAAAAGHGKEAADAAELCSSRGREAACAASLPLCPAASVSAASLPEQRQLQRQRASMRAHRLQGLCKCVGALTCARMRLCAHSPLRGTCHA